MILVFSESRYKKYIHKIIEYRLITCFSKRNGIYLNNSITVNALYYTKVYPKRYGTLALGCASTYINFLLDSYENKMAQRTLESLL